MKRILAFTLIFAMLFTAMLGVMSSAAQKINENGYTGQTPTLKIEHANVEFGSTVYLLVAVDYYVAGIEYDKDNARPKAEIKVDVTNKAGEVTTLTPDYSYFDNLTQTEKDDLPFKYDSHVVFKYTDLAAKEMADTLTIRAYTADKNNTECDVADHTIEYSVLEYTIKANAAKADAKLLNALDKMLAFGAAAQDAFGYEGDYALADENGAINYGMVLVGGAATRKVIAPVGSLVNPTADTNTFTSEAALYDMSFNTVDAAALTVASGISRYFYYGADVTGNAGNFVNTDARTHADKNLFNTIDFSKMFSGVQMDNTIEITSKTGMTQTTEDGYKGYIMAMLDNGNTFRVQPAYYRTWGLHPYKNAASAVTSATLKQRMGYLYVNTPANTASDMNYLSIFNNMTANVKALVDAENKITVSVALAVTEANYENTTIEAGFTPTYNGNTQGSVWRSGDERAFLFTVKDGVMYVGETSSKIADLQKIGDSWTNGTKLVMVHFVLDLNRETVTAYNSATGESVVRGLRIAKGFFNQSYNQVFNMRISGEAYVSRITISEGDLFN